MKNAAAHAKKLQTILNKHKVANPPEEMTDPLEQLVYSFLLWETTRKQADTAYGKLKKAFLDHNELRVSDPAEIVEAIGKRYSRAEERAVRLRDAMHSIYLNEHEVTLKPLQDKPKRQARQYLAALEGINPFVVGRVVLLTLGGHAMPVDEALARRLVRDEAADPDASLEEVQAYLEKQVRSSAAAATHATLLAYVEATPAPPRAPARAAPAPATTNKTAGKSADAKQAKSTAKSTKTSKTSKASKTTKTTKTTKSTRKSKG